MKIAVGSDHAGYDLKKTIVNELSADGHKLLDCGTFSTESVDYPDIAESVAKVVLDENIFGILICGTGIGISIAANKIPGIRAAVCRDIYTARMARNHNDCNILALGARTTGAGLAMEIVQAFIKSPFEKGRHLGRVEKIMDIEKKYTERGR